VGSLVAEADQEKDKKKEVSVHVDEQNTEPADDYLELYGCAVRSGGYGK